MIKKICIALLPLSIAATAKTEPTVYYCEMKNLIEMELDGEVITYKPERFTMKIGPDEVSFGGDGYMEGAKYTHGGWDSELGYFRFEHLGSSGLFNNNFFTSSALSIDGGLIAFVARCDKF